MGGHPIKQKLPDEVDMLRDASKKVALQSKQARGIIIYFNIYK